MKAVKIRTGDQLGNIWQGGDQMSTGQAESGAGDAPPSVSEVCSEEDYEPSSSRPTTHNGGRDCMLMGSRECNECVSKFLSTVDYVLVRSVPIA